MESRTPKVDSKTPENQCCAATVEEMCAATLGHYDDISTKAHHWSNQVPQAIKFWYLEKPKLQLALAAAEEKLRKRNSDIEFAKAIVDRKLVERAEAAEARAREAEKDARMWRTYLKYYRIADPELLERELERAALARGEQGREKG